MLAIQLAGDMPGSREDADYVLARLKKIVDECVFDEPSDRLRSTTAEMVRLSVVRDDRAF